jgi:DNA-binding transcriptional LysR family regulator
LDAKALRVFETVARCESMKRAAAELNTVQSNVTARIRLLEDELGVALFERRPNGMKLTPAGVRLLPHAFEVRAALNSARRAIDDVGIPSGPLVIGCRKSTSALHLTRILNSYVTAYPSVDVQIRTETSPLLTQQVLERRIEGALVCNPVSHPELVSETILDEELVIFTALNIASLAELSPENTRLIVLGQGSLYEQQLKTVLTREGVATGRVMELGTLENIIGCVSAGLGITLLPRAVIDAEPAHGMIRAHKVPGEDCRVQTLFIRRRDSFVSSALSVFLANARNYANGLNPERTT